MQYTLLLHSDEAAFAQVPADVLAQEEQAHEAYAQAMTEEGVMVIADWIKPSSTAVTVSITNGQQNVQEGPKTIENEQIGGYYVIEVANLDEAIKWAERCPIVHYGTVELRPSNFN